MRSIKKVLLLILIVLLGTISNFGQIYKYHSLFIYTFTKYIQWPASYQSGDFVISILGDSPITEQLQSLAANKAVGSQKITVSEFKNVQEITKCHILFVPEHKSKDLEIIMQKLEGQPTLIITEKAGMAKRGSCINFVLVDGKVKFELNKDAAEKANLKISNELAKLAIEVN